MPTTSDPSGPGERGRLATWLRVFAIALAIAAGIAGAIAGIRYVWLTWGEPAGLALCAVAIAAVIATTWTAAGE